MASTDSASTDKEDQVVAVLAARTPGPHFVEPERRLTFTTRNPVIPIGRASKVPTKGFVAASDNAWFDSPVMSRGHAELSVDFNTTPKTIYIKDVGSLHGTFHKRGDGSDGLGKEDKLERGQMVKLESGDTLRFGIDIYRAKETFPPCCVDFLVEETTDRPDLSQPKKSAMDSARRCFSVSVPEDDFDDEDILSDKLGEEYGTTDFEDEDEALDLHYTDGSPSSLSSDDEPLDDSMFPDDQSRSESIPSSPVEPEAKTLPSKLPDGDTTEVGQSSEDPVSHRLASTAPFTSFVNRHRLPSPSDAAMVKTLPFGGWCATTSTAQALGEMTGKYEYFTAREDNRATFMNMDRPRSPPIPISAIRETLGASELARDAAGPCNSPVHTIFLAPKPAMSNKLGVTKSSDASPLVDSPKPVESSSSGRTAEGPKPAPTGINQDSVWSTSGDKFINSPASAEPSSSRTRLQSPDFDMTSAFTFQQSKLAKENKTEHTVKPVRIQDLLAQEPNSMEPLEKTIKPVVTIREYTDNTPRAQTGSKRTFDDAFDDLDLMESDDDIADVISNSSDAIALRDLELPAGSSQPKQDSITGAVSESLAASPRQIAARPAKRRRFAEVAACVAIGGASVLSALIMSAPTFT
ncbi:putative fha domain protein [Eutypa lata UCREL1]|uniref:Putative fha domain protein n=1 Tax=Eutypa lata (strain UCR-EL1) TaxID=1287681 RepID=M7THP6_EUTLA|nr:putative fha domain protein [Eutypa lata UCREL1]